MIVDISHVPYHHMVPLKGSIIIVELVSPENTNKTTLRESAFVISNEYSPVNLTETLVVDFSALQCENQRKLLDINTSKNTSKSRVRMEDILDSELKKPPKVYLVPKTVQKNRPLAVFLLCQVSNNNFF